MACFYSMLPGDAIWRHRSRSNLAEALSSCLTASSPYLKQCWLLISEVLWHSHESKSTASVQTTFLSNEFEKYTYYFHVSQGSKSSPSKFRWATSTWPDFCHHRIFRMSYHVMLPQKQLWQGLQRAKGFVCKSIWLSIISNSFSFIRRCYSKWTPRSRYILQH